MSNVDPNKKVSVNYNGADYETAVRHIAFSSGYVAAFDKKARTVYISNEGTYTFRLPTAVMKDIDTKIKVGGNPARLGGGGGSSGGGAANMGQAMSSEFTVTSNTKNSPKSFEEHLKSIAGSNAEVSISAEIGLITVRSNGQSLMRVKSFLDSVISDAMSRVEIEAAIIEVSLQGDMAYGIKWDQILRDRASLKMGFGFDGTSMVTNGGGVSSMTMTTASTSSIINALSQKTGVSVISQPRVVALNHSSALLFDGEQIPYLGTAAQGATTTTGIASGPTGSVSYAIKGLSISILPDIINENEVSVSIVPVISDVGAMQSFQLGNGTTLQAPPQKVKQSYSDILTYSGKTTIIAGSQYKNDGGTRQQIPGLGDIPVLGNLFASEKNVSLDRELVILLRTNVIPYHGEAQIIQESI